MLGVSGWAAHFAFLSSMTASGSAYIQVGHAVWRRGARQGGRKEITIKKGFLHFHGSVERKRRNKGTRGLSKLGSGFPSTGKPCSTVERGGEKGWTMPGGGVMALPGSTEKIVSGLPATAG